ncbi:MAG TPA: sugar ABC transporter permease [Bacteroidota bacterium]|nr:sugar ABC transporter permease [Bacteroidota bacterium]
MTNRTLRHAVTGYAFLLPGLAGFALFTLLPILFSFVISFFDWDLFSSPVFVDTANYGTILSSPGSPFWDYAAHSLFFLVVVPIQMFVALAAASLLNENPKGALLFKALFFIPVVLSVVPVAVIWGYIFDTEHGLMNNLLALAGAGKIAWLYDPSWIRWGISLMTVWQGSAFGTIIYYAALQGIPEQLYEVAMLDGAGRWSRFRSITFPLLLPTHLFLGVTGVIGALQLFAPIQVMTHGNAGGAHTLIIELYAKAYQEFQMGHAAALSWILFLLIAMVSALYWRSLKNRGAYA